MGTILKDCLDYRIQDYVPKIDGYPKWMDTYPMDGYPDRNGKQIRTRVLAKKLKEAVMHAYPDRKWFMDLETGALSIQFLPIATVVVENKSKTEVVWNKKGLQRFKIDKDLVM